MPAAQPAVAPADGQAHEQSAVSCCWRVVALSSRAAPGLLPNLLWLILRLLMLVCLAGVPVGHKARQAAASELVAAGICDAAATGQAVWQPSCLQGLL